MPELVSIDTKGLRGEIRQQIFDILDEIRSLAESGELESITVIGLFKNGDTLNRMSETEDAQRRIAAITISQHRAIDLLTERAEDADPAA